MIIMYKRICIQRMKCRRRLILCCVAREEMPEALDNGSQPYSRAYGYGEPTVTVRSPQGDNCMAGYHCLMPLASLFCNLTSQ